MMNKLLTGAFAASGLMLLSGCSDTFDPSSDCEGRILPVVDVKTDVAAPVAKAKSRATGKAMEISADDLTLRLTADDGSFSKEWAGVGAFDNSEDFAVGTYKFEAYYGLECEEGYEKPYYYGATSIRVKENQTTPANVTSTLANAMLTIIYTENVQKFFTSIECNVTTATGSHKYPTSESRALYVNPGKVDISADVIKQSGAKASLGVLDKPFDAEARHHYTVTVDVDGGGGALSITFNSDLVEENVELDISDAAFSAPAPTLSASGFVPGEPVEVIEKNAAGKLRITATALAKLKTAVLTTKSVSLLSKGWPETVDFAAADAAVLQKLSDLGLEYPGLTGTLSQMAVVDFTKVIENIDFLEGLDNSTEFTLVAKDAYSKVSEPMSLVVNVDKLTLNVLATEPVAMGESQLMVDIEYNGADPAADILFQVKNTRGMWDNTTIQSVTPLARALGSYRIAITIPANDLPITFRAVCGEIVTPEQTVVRGGAPISVNDNDVFATHAALEVMGDNAATYARDAKVYISKNGSDFSEITPTGVDGAKISFASLEPATKYFVKIYANDGYSSAKEFTTEAATQLPNAGMEEWSAEKLGDYQYLWAIGGDAWATVNALTLSNKGSGSGNGLSTGGCAYKATSGTIPANGRSTQSFAGGGTFGTTKHSDGHTEGNASLHSDKQHLGTNAALIRTVGWGSGNTAKASGSGFGTCNNRTVGELYLGSYNGAPDYSGYNLASRPKALKFYYKYDVVSAGNGDFGTVDVAIYDNDGNIIAQNSATLAEKGEYFEETLPLEYSQQVKAARISLVFKSSGNADALNKDTKYWNCPGAKNTSGGEYVGSELYIDDIELVY